jgi:hypothetical protein
MTLTTYFQLAGESEGGACYEERAAEGHPPVIGTLCIQRWALPQPLPSSLRVSLSFFGADHPFAPSAETQPGRRPAGKNQVTAGKSVTVIKNAAATMQQAPEWLEQYLGRTGTVLWTAADGAMVKFDDSATWFTYAELQMEE